MNDLVRLSHTALIARALILITTDLLVLALALLHKCCKLGIVVLRDSPRSHLDLAVTSSLGDVRGDVEDSLLEAGNALVLVETL